MVFSGDRAGLGGSFLSHWHPPAHREGSVASISSLFQASFSHEPLCSCKLKEGSLIGVGCRRRKDKSWDNQWCTSRLSERLRSFSDTTTVTSSDECSTRAPRYRMLSR